MIVILMRLSENGKIKGHRYWPKHSKRTLAFGDITVSLVKSKHFPHRSDDSLDIQREQVRRKSPSEMSNTRRGVAVN